MNKSTSQITLQILISILIVVFYLFISYNVIDGLWTDTALQGFSGIILLLMGLVALVVIITNVGELFD